MRDLVTILFFTIVILSGIHGYCAYFYPNYSFRYKLTVEVDTPDGLKTGSSVIEVSVRQSLPQFSGIANGRHVWYETIGEGVIVDITDGKTLFVLRNKEMGSGYIEHISQIDFTSHTLQSIAYQKSLRDNTRSISNHNRPLMVYFSDINNPQTVTRVDPMNLEPIFGKGVFFRRMTIEQTNDPIEWKMSQRLKWLPLLGGKLLDGSSSHNMTTNILTNRLGGGSFSYGK